MARLSRSRKAVGGLLGLALGAGMVLSGCGSSPSTTTSTGGNGNNNCPSASTVASWHLVNPGQLTIASDTTYAPAEYPDPNNPNTYIGYDMDLAREMAKRMCLTPNIQKAAFDSIISDISSSTLGQQRYDVSFSSFTITDDRLKQVDMIPYLTAGESLLVPAGNPKNLKTLDDICGKIVAVQKGTIEEDELTKANAAGGNCKAAGKPITILSYVDQTVVVQQVLNGRADASYQDQPVSIYYSLLNKGKLDAEPSTVTPSPQGIVVRKDNPDLETAIKSTLAAMQADGTYLTILKKYNAEGEALTS